MKHSLTSTAENLMDYVIYGIQNEFAYNVIKIVIFFFLFAIFLVQDTSIFKLNAQSGLPNN